MGKDYFAPGFTSYKHHLQYETYDITDIIKDKNEIKAVVAGGWAVGAFVFTRVNKYAADRQALLAQIRIVYEDGSAEIIGTDESWLVTMDSPLRFAEFYDGEVYERHRRRKELGERLGGNFKNFARDYSRIRFSRARARSI